MVTDIQNKVTDIQNKVTDVPKVRGVSVTGRDTAFYNIGVKFNEI